MSIAEKLTTVAENQQRVYDAGFTAGQAQGGGGGYTQEEMDKAVADAIEDGKQAEYDRFWDAFQQNGERRNYGQAFAWVQVAGAGWSTEAYNPKYPIICEGTGGGQQVFYYSTHMTDVKVPITFRNTTANLAFGRCYNLKTIPSVTFENATNLDRTFEETRTLETINIYGSIDTNISFAQSPLLTEASVQSIIDALKDLTGQTAQTLTLHATVGAKLTDEQKATITAKNWTLVY